VTSALGWTYNAKGLEIKEIVGRVLQFPAYSRSVHGISIKGSFLY
jgi:hypothetical protein